MLVLRFCGDDQLTQAAPDGGLRSMAENPGEVPVDPDYPIVRRGQGHGLRRLFEQFIEERLLLPKPMYQVGQQSAPEHQDAGKQNAYSVGQVLSLAPHKRDIRHREMREPPMPATRKQREESPRRRPRRAFTNPFSSRNLPDFVNFISLISGSRGTR